VPASMPAMCATNPKRTDPRHAVLHQALCAVRLWCSHKRLAPLKRHFGAVSSSRMKIGKTAPRALLLQQGWHCRVSANPVETKLSLSWDRHPSKFATPVMTDVRKNKWIDPKTRYPEFSSTRGQKIFNVKAEAR
jgi:hypothetical protein